ncbi:DUF6457 domain-containing protein [Pseudosporangium ferrugineum]|uniref:DUF6457 domain-containing protein n=1 Tax=Pseudosporangium ferrugineum TaxID=439699 RepID=A0A2T0S1F1_9ACTN|nr:DUF6457 domain-containing protein [Pseudosporangium ferrugineum]PRY27254.1 hypothetical protein CLV70_111221 [Pseudosporangium ferrugineum]
MNVLEEWLKVAAAELGLSPADVQRTVVLDVARDVAHNVVRPGAPLSAYLMGVAVGRGADPADVAARLTELALKWPADNRTSGPPVTATGTDPDDPGQHRPEGTQRRE